MYVSLFKFVVNISAHSYIHFLIQFQSKNAIFNYAEYYITRLIEKREGGGHIYHPPPGFAPNHGGMVWFGHGSR